mmetsp:Transcript_37625/g.61216  ORF Transcript_37625/g.61216 Transcript_37625/m.61216 type:complete len:335 (+) Transcript_37625:13280-14284(+)
MTFACLRFFVFFTFSSGGGAGVWIPVPAHDPHPGSFASFSSRDKARSSLRSSSDSFSLSKSSSSVFVPANALRISCACSLRFTSSASGDVLSFANVTVLVAPDTDLTTSTFTSSSPSPSLDFLFRLLVAFEASHGLDDFTVVSSSWFREAALAFPSGAAAAAAEKPASTPSFPKLGSSNSFRFFWTLILALVLVSTRVFNLASLCPFTFSEDSSSPSWSSVVSASAFGPKRRLPTGARDSPSSPSSSNLPSRAAFRSSSAPTLACARCFSIPRCINFNPNNPFVWVSSLPSSAFISDSNRSACAFSELSPSISLSSPSSFWFIVLMRCFKRCSS